ncbi:hypothetical protein [Stenotrophomonas sp. YIM B06876]|uniref:hypothetical protein n=1 Tax=Stenotrophomonas sp. YIM B06876 TaxID=3060211 RepID=UPI00273A0990|nr:hypothetical protein [Stenotrophomonas sp. YIM B06876]
MRHRGQAEFGERQALHLDVGRVLVDALLVDAGARAQRERRRVDVGGVRQIVERAAGQRAQALEMRLHVAQQIGRQVQRQQLVQFAVGGEKVLPVAVGHGMVGGGAGRRSGTGHGWSPLGPIVRAATIPV